MTLKIDRAGRIVVPKPVRERLGLRPGSHLEMVEGPDGITIRRAEPKPTLAREGHLLVYTGTLSAGYDVTRAVDDDRQERAREVWSR